MKSREKYKKNSGLLSLSKSLISSLVLIAMASNVVLAEPVIAGINLPPASFTYVDDPGLLRDIGLDGFDSAWCYDNHANAILITAPARSTAQCELKMKYEIEKQKVKNQFEIDKLNIRIESLIKQHEELSKVKDVEIERLTAAALKRPNDYTVWWASGGLVVGVLSTVLVTLAVSE